LADAPLASIATPPSANAQILNVIVLSRWCQPRWNAAPDPYLWR
jgi:hypothetical protein